MTSSGKPKAETLSGIPPAKLFDFFLWLIGKRKRYKLQGESMTPLLFPGDMVFVKKSCVLSVGDLVVAKDSSRGITIVKKIHSINGRQIQLKGVNRSKSSDVTVPKSDVLGIVTSLLKE